MNDEVMQNSNEISRVSSDVKNKSQRLDELVDQYYKIMDESFGLEDDGNKAWFGPKSAKFLEEANAEKSKYKAQVENLKNIADTIDRHAQRWEEFETNS